MARPRVFLVDSFGFIFRAFHARARMPAPTMRTSTGLPTEAVYIFSNMLRKLTAQYKPEYIAAVFESAGPTFREREFADYKANRTEMPPELGQQIVYIRRLLEGMRIPVLEHTGFEADDVIGAIARRAEQAGMDVAIVSSDKDMLQLVNDRVLMYNPMQDDLWYDAAKVEEKMGVKPEQVADLLALKGDAIDNIPGAPGIGDKGARELVLRFGSVEAAIERAAELGDKGFAKRYRDSLQQNREQILLSKRLATIDTSVPIEFQRDALRVAEADTAALKQLYKELEFYSLLKELGPEEDTRPWDYQTLDSVDALDAWLASIPAGAAVAVAVGARTPDDGEGAPGMFAAEDEPLIGLAWRPTEARAVPRALVERLRPLLEDAARPKAAHDVKRVDLSLAARGVVPRGFRDDAMLYAFLLNADPSGCSLESLARKHLDRRLETEIGRQAGCTLELAASLSRQVDERGFRTIYETIDLPLAHVLAHMERTGVRVDPAELRRLSAMMDAEIERLTAEICGAAGKQFNINSPQQLGKVLFEDLQLPAPQKHGKGKAISTAADVLEDLAADHEIVRKVLEYRQLTKLKGTYVDALPALIDPHTGRLHTRFNQIGAATGRLSSSNPNLQNIPIRTELGREIRAAFIPREGWKLVVADYSQIELRLLAHFARCPVLLEAFRNGEDIHTRTAAEVFGVPPLMVNPELRRRAKAVNFGIVYGLSAFGLAAQLGIPRQEAQSYIDNYFERYKGVRRFIDDTIAEVRCTGVTRTLFGRERPIPDMNNRNPNARGFAERTAVNTPLQGTAADLIKLAMIRIEAELERRKLRTAMLLQVHDELVFEAPPEEVDDVRKLVKSAMENVHKLETPLVADVSAGGNWRDAK